jgi:flagellar motility protein MotE (MotC chaperone)
MGWFEWLAQLAVAALLAGTIPVALRLERALRAVRRDREHLEGCAAVLDEAARRAEAASLRLRREAEESLRTMGEGMAAAEPLRDELHYLLERAEAVAGRLDGLVRAARGAPAAQTAPLATAPPAAPKPVVESRAARDLLLALARRSS